MNTAMVVIGLIFMGMSTYQLNKKTHMDAGVLQNYERRYTVLNPEKLLKVEYSTKALFGGFVAMMGMVEQMHNNIYVTAIAILIGAAVWQMLDRQLKKPFLGPKKG